jgi:type IV pilus assembly protein PilA
MRRVRGFSLIELLIVVAIILIIAAIAVPSYLHARIEANESSAVGSLRTVNTAQITFNSSYPTVGYAGSLTALGGTSCSPPNATSACLIDTLLAGGLKSGYTFSLSGASGTPNATYQLIATPNLWDVSGIRYFCSFQDAVVRYSLTTITTCDATVSSLN